MRELGNRMQKRTFHDLTQSVDIKRQVKVDITQLIRTEQSADEYLNGFLNFTSVRPSYDYDEDGWLLKYPDVCTKYNKIVKAKDSCSEGIEFENKSNELRGYKQNFLKKLGVDLIEMKEDLGITFFIFFKA